MDLVWGLVIIGLGLLAWGGQAASWLAPETAARAGLMERRESVEPAFWADIRGEAVWDVLVLWTLPVAGILLLVGEDAWAWLGLIGGGMYVYFGGRGILTRLELRRGGFRIGEASSVRLGLGMLGVWAAAGLVTAMAAVSALA